MATHQENIKKLLDQGLSQKFIDAMLKRGKKGPAKGKNVDDKDIKRFLDAWNNTPEGQTSKYYSEKRTDVETKATTDSTRIQEDLSRIIEDLGISKTRATEDYIRNVGNLEAEKALDVEDLRHYVTTNTSRTQEDLDTSLAKEARRFAIEEDAINRNLADRGLTFSERTEEKRAQEASQETVADVRTEAERSFSDIRRYETAKDAEINLKYGYALQSAAVEKDRNLVDILRNQSEKEQAARRGQEDIAFGKAIDIRELNYAESDDLSDIQDSREQQQNFLKNQKELLKVMGA